MKELSLLLFVLVFTALAAVAANPVPAISEPLVPTSVPPGSPSFTLTVNGTGFVPGSVVNWNGSPRATWFVSTGRLTATITASDTVSVGTNYILVFNPGSGGGTSDTVPFTVRVPSTGVALRKIKPDVGSAGDYFVIADDFNHDSNPDFALVGSHDKMITVSVGLSTGPGSFDVGQDYSLGLGAPAGKPIQLVTADFNGDGNFDLAVAAGPVWVLLGNGNGTFQAPTQYLASCLCGAVVARDIDADGTLDLVLGSQSKNGLNPVLLGNGDGTFRSGTSYGGGTNVAYMVAGDFNGDGVPDLALVPNPKLNEFCIHFGNGDGTFSTGPCTSHPPATVSISTPTMAIADLNGDGKADLVMPPGVVALGNGDGTFQVSSLGLSQFLRPVSFAIADFNGDGIPDLAFADALVANGLMIALGQGDGTVSSAIAQIPIPAHQRSMAIADFNRDGKLDIVVGHKFGPVVLQK